MSQFDEQAAQLPPPRADEPANLRREIIDELSDHLTCARKREQLAGGSQTEEAIRNRILDRFGDPAAVARKLWLDWMWEKIMTQRILVVTCILTVVLSCVALGLAWASLERQQDLIATWQSTSETQVRDQQKLFERLLAQSEKLLLQGSSKAPTSLEWNPVELRFVAGTENGPPVEKVEGRLEITTEGSGIPPLYGVSDANGILRFERVHYGTYRLRVFTPAGESDSMTLTQQAGQGMSRKIVCPDPPAKPVNVNVRIEWPADLLKRSLWFRFKQNAVYRPIGDALWSGPLLLRGTYHESLVAEPNGQLNGTQFVEANQQTFGRGIGRRRERTQLSPLPFIRWDHFTADRVENIPNGIAWPGIGYEIRDIEVLIPVPDITSMEQLHTHQPESESIRASTQHSSQKLFFARHLRSAGWPHRIQPGDSDKPGTLWLTPTTEEIEKLRAALAEIEEIQEAQEKAAAEARKAAAESADQEGNASDSSAAAKE